MNGHESRVKKTLLNAKVNFVFYLIALVLSFFSRKLFLDCLDANFVGLTGTLNNILGYLNLAELGIGAAISYYLYKPIQECNKKKIIDLVSLFGYYYRNIGIIVLSIAIIISIFFPTIFRNSGFSLGIIYFAFYSFLMSSLIGYFANFRQILLNADQRSYVVAAYYQTGAILKTIVQMIVAYKYANYYAWVAIEFSFGIIYSIILNYKIDQVYPWLKCSIKYGKSQAKVYPDILNSTKQIFIHKLKDFALKQSDQLFIFAFVSLKMVAYYGNYTLVISKLTTFFGTLIDSVGASIGNLVAEGNADRIFKVFWEISALRYFISGIICFSTYNLIQPFIILWLGNEYLLSDEILYLLLTTEFIYGTRGTIDNFNFAYGHYADIWAAWTEGIINICVTIVCGYFFGISGILIGKLASMVPIIVFWKPLYLFKYGFKKPYLLYWKNTVKYYIIFIICTSIINFLIKFVPINPILSYGWWITYACICSGGFILLYLCTMIWFGPGGKDLIHRLPILNKL
jgi:O-antigen/teichoic acid export membrane protein